MRPWTEWLRSLGIDRSIWKAGEWLWKQRNLVNTLIYTGVSAVCCLLLQAPTGSNDPKLQISQCHYLCGLHSSLESFFFLFLTTFFPQKNNNNKTKETTILIYYYLREITQILNCKFSKLNYFREILNFSIVNYFDWNYFWLYFDSTSLYSTLWHRSCPKHTNNVNGYRNN